MVENGNYTKHKYLCSTQIFVWGGGSYKSYILNTNTTQIFVFCVSFRFHPIIVRGKKMSFIKYITITINIDGKKERLKGANKS